MTTSSKFHALLSKLYSNKLFLYKKQCFAKGLAKYFGSIKHFIKIYFHNRKVPRISQVFLTLIIIILANFSIFPQANSENFFIQPNQSNFASLEEYLEAISIETGEADNLLEIIDYFASNPIDLLHSSVNQIAEIPGLSYFDAYSIYEALRRDSTLSYDAIFNTFKFNEYQRWILENCTVLGAVESKLLVKLRERTAYQLETPAGYEKDKYIGEKWSLYQKYGASYNINTTRYSAGTTINKGPGEQSINEYISGFITCDLDFAEFIIGDFEVKTGMGNVFGESFRQSKGVNVVLPTINFVNKLSPYTSKMDYRVMRGGAARLSLPLPFSTTNESFISSSVWYSSAPRSATFSKDSSYISSIFTSGYYRTPNDVSKKNAISETNIGGTLELSGCNYNLGAVLAYLDYGHEIRSSSSRIFSGKAGFVSSVFGSYNWKDIILCSEIATDNNSNFGVKLTTAYNTKALAATMHFRSFDELYRAPYGTMFGEFSYPANELGLYLGIVWKSGNKYKLSTYIDLFKSYTSTYTIDTIVWGYEFFAEFNWRLNKESALTFRIKEENKTASETVSKTKYFYQQDNLLFRTEYKNELTKALSVRARFDIVYINNANVIDDEAGIAFFAEASYNVLEWLKVQARATLFSTQSYNSAIWQFEYFYPGYSLSTAMYLEGARAYLQLQLQCKLAKWGTAYLRWENVYKPGEVTLGSGNELIKSNTQNRIYCQIDIKF